jgi:hypothetical protein
LCTICWQFLWIVPSSCIPYVGSFSGLSLRLVYPMLAVSLDCPFVLCTLCWQFLWIVSSSCVPYVVSFSGLSLRLVYPMLAVSLDCPFVLCTLCWQFLWIVPSSCVPYVANFYGLSLRYSLTLLTNNSHCNKLESLYMYNIIFRVRFMVFSASFHNISVISWRSVLLVEETTDLSKVTEEHNLHTLPLS